LSAMASCISDDELNLVFFPWWFEDNIKNV
jgi:hypothetical protein